VIPIENSLGGSIHQNYDLLVRHDLHVTREIYLRVEHALLAKPGTKLSDIREVRSHPQALAQCAGFFAKNRNIRPVVWFDTAGAARSLVEGDPTPARDGAQVNTIAAIASTYAGELYGLTALKKNLQDRKGNYTRFLCIARKPEAASAGAALKTSLSFVPARNRAGVLHAVTGLFASRGLDLTKIESRPDPDNAFDYRFYLDVSGGAKDAPLRAALAELKGLTRDLRVLGSYPRAALPKK
jgi:prephenate dehydratase